MYQAKDTDLIQDLLSPTGVAYLIALKQNDISSIRSAMSLHHHLHSEVNLSPQACLSADSFHAGSDAA
jgi:hypothetical protein